MATFDIRKLVKSGETSFHVVLPRSWVNYYELRPGDNLYVLNESQLIVIAPTNVDIKKLKSLLSELCRKLYAVDHAVENKREGPQSPASTEDTAVSQAS